MANPPLAALGERRARRHVSRIEVRVADLAPSAGAIAPDDLR
jgi:hypothetical protein